MTTGLVWRQRLMMAVLVIAAYAPTLKTGFLWDDHVMIEANRTLESWSVSHLKHDFTTDVFDRHGDPYYRPLQTVMNRIDRTLWGLRPFGFHLTNLLFHLGNTLLVAELVLALGALPLTAFITGSLFAVHPIVVEQLLIIAGRAELMGLFFSLLALLLFLKHRDASPPTPLSRWERGSETLLPSPIGRGSDAKGDRGEASRRYDIFSLLAGWLAYILAVFSKESSIVLPFLLGLIYYTRREPLSKNKRLLPMALAIAPYLWLRHQVVGPVVAHQDLWLTLRFFVQEFPSVIIRYLSLILLPWNLHSHRLLPHISHFWPVYLLVLLGGCYFLIKRWGRPAIFCIGWFLLMLLPKTPVMIYGNFMLDHWAYPASLAVFLPLGWAVNWGWQSRRDQVRTVTAFLYFSLLIAWSLLVHLNVALRGTDEKMYRWALNFTTSNPVKYNLAVLLTKTGRPAEAVELLEDFRKFYPDNPDSAHLLALACLKLGDRRKAIRVLEEFSRQFPEDAMTRSHLQQLKALR